MSTWRGLQALAERHHEGRGRRLLALREGLGAAQREPRPATQMRCTEGRGTVSQSVLHTLCSIKKCLSQSIKQETARAPARAP